MEFDLNDYEKCREKASRLVGNIYAVIDFDFGSKLIGLYKIVNLKISESCVHVTLEDGSGKKANTLAKNIFENWFECEDFIESKMRFGEGHYCSSEGYYVKGISSVDNEFFESEIKYMYLISDEMHIEGDRHKNKIITKMWGGDTHGFFTHKEEFKKFVMKNMFREMYNQTYKMKQINKELDNLKNKS